MSVASFQQALCDLIASPRLCRALRAAPEEVLANYELSARERARLCEVVWQRDMLRRDCSLYRANRAHSALHAPHLHVSLSWAISFGPCSMSSGTRRSIRTASFQARWSDSPFSSASALPKVSYRVHLRPNCWSSSSSSTPSSAPRASSCCAKSKPCPRPVWIHRAGFIRWLAWFGFTTIRPRSLMPPSATSSLPRKSRARKHYLC